MDCITFTQTKTAITRIAKQAGFTGDPLADPPPLATGDEELAAVNLYLAIPPRLRLIDRDLVHRMCRAVVLTTEGRRDAFDQVKQAHAAKLPASFKRRRAAK
ncbi:MAG: hypothetical protein KDA42_06115 [Planctomycetales bacterium]|nr:hypothetical protein [Planctomycetales bacterium]